MWEKIYKVVFIAGFTALFLYVAFGKEYSRKKQAEELPEIVMDANSEKEMEESEISLSTHQECTDKEMETSVMETGYSSELSDPSKDPVGKEYWSDCIRMEVADGSESFNENVVGYTLWNYTMGNLSNYYLDPDWVLPEELAGRGVYVSEHMCEVEAFLGGKLAALLTDRGAVREEDRQYYTEWATQQLSTADWSALDKGWEVDPFAYGREYCPASLAGTDFYSFQYHFYPKQECIVGDYTQTVSLTLLVDGNGQVCGITPRIHAKEVTGWARNGESDVGLCNEHFRESIIGGESSKGKNMVLDFSSSYRGWREAYEPKGDTDTLKQAEKMAGICIDMLESRGEHAARYTDVFAYESEYEEFADLPWSRTEENWTADEEYNCEYVDHIYENCGIGFRYCFFPNYEKMETDRAQAFFATCDFWEDDKGIICYKVDCVAFQLSREKYLSREKTTKVQVVKDGKVCNAAENISLPVPQTAHPHVLLRYKTFDKGEEAGIRHEEARIWGCQNVAEFAGCLGDRIKEDMKKDIKAGYASRDITSTPKLLWNSFLECTGEGMDEWEVYGYKIDGFRTNLKEKGDASGWNPGNDYDCFYVKENERAGCIHLRYYFYPQKPEAGNENKREWVLVLDAYVSERGVEDLGVNSFVRQAE